MDKAEENQACEASYPGKEQQHNVPSADVRAIGSRTALVAGDQSNKALWEQLRNKDAQITILHQKLAHFRSWIATVQTRVHAMNPPAIKNAKRLYVGNLPQGMTEEELKQYLNSLMVQTGGVTVPGNAVTACKIIQDKGYGFVEFRSVEEASNAMALDGVACKDSYIKLRRPSNYDMATSHMLGPVTPDPTMDTTTLDICRTMVEDSPNKLFIGGLASDWGEEQVKELLLPYGALRSFNLVMDKATGKSKGYAFCEFADEALTDFVIGALGGKKAGGKSLTVKRALEGGRHGVGGGPASSTAASVQGLPNGTGSANSSGLLQLAASSSSTPSGPLPKSVGAGQGYPAGPQGHPLSASSSEHSTSNQHVPQPGMAPAGPFAPSSSPPTMSMYMAQGGPRSRAMPHHVPLAGSPPHMGHGGPRMLGPGMPPLGPMPIPPIPMGMGSPGPHGMAMPGFGFYPPGQPFPPMPMPGPPHHFQAHPRHQGNQSHGTARNPRNANPAPPASQSPASPAQPGTGMAPPNSTNSSPSKGGTRDAVPAAQGAPKGLATEGAAGASVPTVSSNGNSNTAAQAAPAHMATGGSPQQAAAAAAGYAVTGVAGNRW